MMEKKDMQQQQQQLLIKEVSDKEQNCSVFFFARFFTLEIFFISNQMTQYVS